MATSGSVPVSNISGSTALTNSPLEIPENEYNHRLNEWQRRLAEVRALHYRLWTYLVVVLVGGIAVTVATLSSPSVSKLWFVLPLVLIPSTLQFLAKNASRHGRMQRIVNFYEFGIARLQHRWQGQGMGGEEFRPDRHPYAADLDLFGTGSLFELLCTARTGVGRAKLADWLLSPAACDEASERQ